MSDQPKNNWQCEVCGFMDNGDDAPEACPVCGVGKECFQCVEKTSVPEPTPSEQEDQPTPRWKCVECGYIHQGEQPPERCPICGAPAEKFEQVTGATASDKPAPAIKAVVVGGGIAGVTAAETINEVSPESKVMLVSQESVPPYHRLNLTRLLAGEVEESELWLHPQDWYADHQIDLRTNTSATAISPDTRSVTLSTGEVVEYDKLILAQGADPFVPPIEGLDLERVVVFRTLEDARQILELADQHNECVVVGGGLLGLETAGGLARRGITVTVIEGAPWLLPRQLNETGGQMLQKHVQSLGIRVITGAKPAALTGANAVEQVVLDDETVLETGFVVVSVGIRANLSLAQKTGLDTNKGVVVNDALLTSDPHIFAAGDGIEHHDRLYGLWYASQFQGQIAGLNAVEQKAEFGGLPLSAMLKVLGIEVFSAGEQTPADDQDLIVEHQHDHRYIRFLLRDHALVGAIVVGDSSQIGKIRSAVEQQRDCSPVVSEELSAEQLLEFLVADH